MFRRSWLSARESEPIVITLMDGKVVRGWLARVGRSDVVLRAAQLLIDEAPDPIQLGGELIIHQSNINFVQTGIAW